MYGEKFLERLAELESLFKAGKIDAGGKATLELFAAFEHYKEECPEATYESTLEQLKETHANRKKAIY